MPDIQPVGQTSPPGRGTSQLSSPREGNNEEFEAEVRVECEEDVKQGNNNGIPDVKSVVLSRHKLEPREKIHVCGSAECAQVWRSVYSPRRLQGNRHCL